MSDFGKSKNTGDDETDDRKEATPPSSSQTADAKGAKNTDAENQGKKADDAEGASSNAESKEDAEGPDDTAEQKVNHVCLTYKGQGFVNALVNGNIEGLKLGIGPALERVIHFITQLKTNQNPLKGDDEFKDFIEHFIIQQNIQEFLTNNVTCTFDAYDNNNTDNPFYPYKIELMTTIQTKDHSEFIQVLNKHLQNRYSEPSPSSGGGKTRKRVRKHKRKQRKSAKRKSSRKRKTK
jgi:hypothetical protein